MIKVFICFLFSTLLLVNSCTDTITPEYNILDPKNPNYSPTAPRITTLLFSSTPTGVKIFWNDNSLGEIKFEIEKGDSINISFSKIGEMPANSEKYKMYIDNFIPQLNTIYYYRIRAISANGNFTYSQERSIFF